MREIIVAEGAGFCSGVKRAVNIAIRAAEKHGKAYTIGLLVHNDDALKTLKEKNVFPLDDSDGIPLLPSDGALIIRSHGVGEEVYKSLEGYVYYDATCPYVKKIHERVRRIKGEECVIVIGDKNHPEVKGIVGHIKCKSYTVMSKSELYNLINLGGTDSPHECVSNEDVGFRHNALTFVAQTTFNRCKWREYIQIIKKHCTNAKIFDTICYATFKRQETAEALSKSCDAMIVIGSVKSSNSLKLYEICAKNCENSFFIENAQDLRAKGIMSHLSNKKDIKIGITAGASVPAEIIKEVHSIMNEDIKTVDTDDIEMGEIDFMAEVDKTFRKIHTGKRVEAYVIAVNDNEVVVDLGTKHSGYIPADEIGGDPGTMPADIVKVGDKIDCIVTKINDSEGIVYLSRKKITSELGLQKLALAYENDEIVEGYVASVVNGGVILIYEGARVFIPASQSGVPKSGNLETLLKRTVKFKVIEINEQRRRHVGSIRAASRLEMNAAREKFWSEIEVGKKYTGEVKSMESYGVFVDLGGVDGMVHLSELTWGRIKHPKDAVSIGDTLNVTVKSFDLEKQRVSLSAKNPDENPWIKFTESFEEGSTAKATIVNIVPFGAFAQIMPGIDGLIHISQIAKERIINVNEALKVGQEVDVMITEIDTEKERVSISMKALLGDDGDNGDSSDNDSNNTDNSDNVNDAE